MWSGRLIRLLGGMWTFLKFIFVGFGLLLFSLEILFLVAFCCLDEIQNVTYARSAFGPIYNIKRVVASQRWHRQVFGCTYAVVELTPARTAELVAGNKFRDVFGDQAMYWMHPANTQPTPLNLFSQEGCFFEGMSNADKRAILDGLNQPGGWAGVFGEYRVFFLPKRNLIGIMRYGD